MKRIHEKFVMTRNPMNYHQVSRISLSPDVVDCIVFWSKNPTPLVPYLDEINREYPFYFQFTINDYKTELEPNVPPMEERINIFRYLSRKYGKERVIWRYDPIILSQKYDVDWHKNSFERIAGRLSGYTDTCVFSFVDIYDKIKGNLRTADYLPLSSSATHELAKCFSAIAGNYDFNLKTCAEEINLGLLGIEHSCCIDPKRISQIIDCQIDVKKDSNQRGWCGCVESIDIGQYNTCRHGCKYCYANYSASSVQRSCAMHDPDSPMLIGNVEPTDKINDRKVTSIKHEQISLFDV